MRPKLFAEVAVGASDVRGDRMFHYAVPRDLKAKIAVGQLVLVEFGRRELHGVVAGFNSTSPVSENKPVLDVVWEAPLLDGCGIKFLRWVAESYGATLSSCLESFLPANLKNYLDYSYSLSNQASIPLARDMGLEALKIAEVIRDRGSVSGKLLSELMGKSVSQRVVGELMSQELLVRRGRLSLPSLGVRTALLSVPIRQVHEAIAAMTRAPKRRALLEVLVEASGPVSVSDLLIRAGTTSSALKPLVDAGLVDIQTHANVCHMVPTRDRPRHLPDLEDLASCRVLEKFVGRKGHGVCLLLGEYEERSAVYVRAVQGVVSHGQQVLILAPTEREAQTLYQMLDGAGVGSVEFAGRAKTPVQRVGLWRAIRSGEVDVVVGIRSAVFAPLTRLGLIIVEREEDPNYKDRRGTRVQARDAAVQLGKLQSCPVVLGSDNPSVKTFYEVEKERYRFILMGGAKLLRATRMKVGRGWGSQRPAGVVDVVDMRSAACMGHGGVISEHLHRGLVAVTKGRSGAILFVNRRGSAALTLCQECGFTFGCRNCSTSMVHHRSSRSLVCHICNERQPIPQSCPACGGSRLHLWGHGTEAVSQTLKRLFPRERVERLDSDIEPRLTESIADGFRRGAVRFLVGTTTLFKVAESLRGSLLGVVQADLGLGFPDYTASESVFRTLMRLRRCVVGGGMDGRVILQTIMPEHHVVEAMRVGSYVNFFRSELEIRRAHQFPPFRRLVRFVYSHKSSEKARREAELLFERLRLVMSDSGRTSVQFMGPAPAFRHRSRGRYSWHLIVLGTFEDLATLASVPHRGWVVDADPVQFY